MEFGEGRPCRSEACLLEVRLEIDERKIQDCKRRGGEDAVSLQKRSVLFRLREAVIGGQC